MTLAPMTLAQILAFLPAACAVGSAPGANNLLAFASATRAGWRRAAAAVLGRVAAWAVLVVLVAFGLDALLRQSEMAFLALKWCGVAYLAWLAWKSWHADTEGEIEAPATHTLLRREFLTLMGNPKAYVLLSAFLPQFVQPGAALLPQLLVLGGLYLVVDSLAALLWVSFGAALGRHALTPLRRRVMNRVSAGLMAAAAGLLARSARA